MAVKVSQLLTPEYSIIYGKDLKTASGQTTIEPGLLVYMASGSTVSLSGSAANRPAGWAFGARYGVYAPTTRVFGENEPLSIVKGYGLALLSADFFIGGTLPTAGQALYAGQGGKWSTIVGSYRVGTCIDQRGRFELAGAFGTAQDCALVEFNIEPGTA